MKSFTSTIAAGLWARVELQQGQAAGAAAGALLFSGIVSIISWGAGTENFA